MADATAKPQNAMQMLKLAYFSLIAGVLASLAHIVAGTGQTRALMLGLFLASAVLTVLGLRRGP